MPSSTPKANYFNFKNGDKYYTLDLSSIPGFKITGSGSFTNCDYKATLNNTSNSTGYTYNGSKIYATADSKPQIIGFNVIANGATYTTSSGTSYKNSGGFGITSVTFDTESTLSGTLYINLRYKESLSGQGDWSSSVIAKFSSISSTSDGNGSHGSATKQRIRTNPSSPNITSLTIDGIDYTQQGSTVGKNQCDIYHSDCAEHKPSSRVYINDTPANLNTGYHNWIIEMFVIWDDGMSSDTVETQIKVIASGSDNPVYNQNLTTILGHCGAMSYAPGTTVDSCYIEF